MNSCPPGLLLRVAHHVIVNGRFFHDAIVNALEPIVEPAVYLSLKIEVKLVFFDLAVIRRTDKGFWAGTPFLVSPSGMVETPRLQAKPKFAI